MIGDFKYSSLNLTKTLSVVKGSRDKFIFKFYTMLKNILNIKGIELIKKENQKNINGGNLCIDEECPIEGGSCCGPVYRGPWCMAGPQNLGCVNGVWMAC
jgi:hypothetical protein